MRGQANTRQLTDGQVAGHLICPGAIEGHDVLITARPQHIDLCQEVGDVAGVVGHVELHQLHSDLIDPVEGGPVDLSTEPATPPFVQLPEACGCMQHFPGLTCEHCACLSGWLHVWADAPLDMHALGFQEQSRAPHSCC